jgi:protein-S-isoprenylcysteine O-methyltransferase Ste14
MNRDLLIYAVHAGFWGSFGLTRRLSRSHAAAGSDAPRSTPHAAAEASAPYSRSLILLATLAFGVMYFGVGNAVIPDRVPQRFPGQRTLGLLVIAIGALFMSWAIVSFRSWRFRAKVDPGHELVTGGPFRFVRHPIYLGLNLLAVGTACWVPTVTVWVGAALMVLSSDLRARAEEALLTRVFGPVYAEYRSRTSRFVPGVY